MGFRQNSAVKRLDNAGGFWYNEIRKVLHQNNGSAFLYQFSFNLLITFID